LYIFNKYIIHIIYILRYLFDNFKYLYVFILVSPHRKEKIFGYFYSQGRLDKIRVQREGIDPKSIGGSVGILEIEVPTRGSRSKEGSIAGRFHFRKPKHQNPTTCVVVLAVFPNP
jgi:hypothetical protein